MFKKRKKEEIIKVIITNEATGDLLDSIELVDAEDVTEIELKDKKEVEDMKDMDYMDSVTVKGLMDMFPGMEKEAFRKTIIDACGAYKTSLKDAADKSKILKDSKEKEKVVKKEKVIIENLIDAEDKDAEKKSKDLIDAAKKSVNDSEAQIAKETAAQSKYDKLLKF